MIWFTYQINSFSRLHMRKNFLPTHTVFIVEGNASNLHGFHEDGSVFWLIPSIPRYFSGSIFDFRWFLPFSFRLSYLRRNYGSKGIILFTK